ncbi:MAG: hypothetical protein EOP07_14680, partial [Proteobacteria bacterium]
MVEAIQHIIRQWLASRKHRSLKQLSEESGLNYGTIRNMADGKAVPNGETILRLLLVTLPLDEMHEFVSRYLPHLSPYTQAIRNHGGKVSHAFAITRKHCAIILEIGFARTSPEQLKAKFGPSTDRCLEELLAEEIILLEDGFYRLPETELFVPTETFAVEMSRLIQDNLDISLKGNLIHAQSAALSIEATRQVYTLMEKTRNELFAILKDPNNSGETRVALSLAMTLF